jgi:hypothetical protein
LCCACCRCASHFVLRRAAPEACCAALHAKAWLCVPLHSLAAGPAFWLMGNLGRPGEQGRARAGKRCFLHGWQQPSCN